MYVVVGEVLPANPVRVVALVDHESEPFERWTGRPARVRVQPRKAHLPSLVGDRCHKKARHPASSPLGVDEEHVEETFIGDVAESHDRGIDYRDESSGLLTALPPHLKIDRVRRPCFYLFLGVVPDRRLPHGRVENLPGGEIVGVNERPDLDTHHESDPIGTTPIDPESVI